MPTNANKLLAGLDERDRARLEPALETVPLPLGMTLERPHENVPYVYFVHTGIVSVVARSKRSQEAEVGLIGNEGVTGLNILLGVNVALTHAMVQAAGGGDRIAVAELRRQINGSAALRQHLHRYAYAYFLQTSHTAVANAKGLLEERLARWLLMAQDRLGSDSLNLTHQFLSMMLAVRRAGVTIATHVLEGKGLIRARPGSITVIDREGLVEAANGLYGMPEEHYARVMNEPLDAV